MKKKTVWKLMSHIWKATMHCPEINLTWIKFKTLFSFSAATKGSLDKLHWRNPTREVPLEKLSREMEKSKWILESFADFSTEVENNVRNAHKVRRYIT